MSDACWKALRLSRGASLKEIKAAYRAQAQLWHPDKHASGTPAQQAEAARRFKQIAEAYEALSNPQARRQHAQAPWRSHTPQPHHQRRAAYYTKYEYHTGFHEQAAEPPPSAFKQYWNRLSQLGLVEGLMILAFVLIYPMATVHRSGPEKSEDRSPISRQASRNFGFAYLGAKRPATAAPRSPPAPSDEHHIATSPLAAGGDAPSRGFAAQSAHVGAAKSKGQGAVSSEDEKCQCIVGVRFQMCEKCKRARGEPRRQQYVQTKHTPGTARGVGERARSSNSVSG